MTTKLRLYIADLWCFVREESASSKTFWGFAPNTSHELPPYRHKPYLFFCEENPKGPTETFPHTQSQKEQVWDLDGCELSFPGLKGKLDQMSGTGPMEETKDPEEYSLDWLIKFEELLATKTKTMMGPRSTLKHGNGDGAIQARLKLQCGEIRVLAHTWNKPKKEAACIYFEHKGKAGLPNTKSGVPKEKARPMGLWVVAEMETEENFINVMRTPFNGGIPQVEELKQRHGKKSIDLVLLNTAGPAGENLDHFPLLYPLINGWTEEYYVPHQEANKQIPLPLSSKRESGARKALLKRMKPSVANLLEPIDNTFSTDSKNCIPAVSDGFDDAWPLTTDPLATTKDTKNAEPIETPENQSSA